MNGESMTFDGSAGNAVTPHCGQMGARSTSASSQSLTAVSRTLPRPASAA